MQQIRVLLVDDHLHVHTAVDLILDNILDIQLIKTAYSGEDAIIYCQKHTVDVVLMDIVMPGMGGLETTRKILKIDPNISVLVLSSYQDMKFVKTALKDGAVGYILKSSLIERLIPAIRSAFAGSTVMAPEISHKLLELFARTDDEVDTVFNLTDREIEVLQLIALGLNNKEVADKLSISRSTVKFHLANIIEKMQVETRAEAIVLAAKSNLV